MVLLLHRRLLHGRQGGRGGRGGAGSGARERVGGTDIQEPARHAPARPAPLLRRGGGGHGGDGRDREWLRLLGLGWGLLVEGRGGGGGGKGEVVVEGQADVAACFVFRYCVLCGWVLGLDLCSHCLRFNESDTHKRENKKGKK